MRLLLIQRLSVTSNVSRIIIPTGMKNPSLLSVLREERGGGTSIRDLDGCPPRLTSLPFIPFTTVDTSLWFHQTCRRGLYTRPTFIVLAQREK